VLAAYPSDPRRRALETIGVDTMFVAPRWALTDAYSAHAPTYVYRFDHTPATLRVTGLDAVHGCEIVHILHTDASHLGRRLHPLGAGGPQRSGPGCSGLGWSSPARRAVPGTWSNDWPCYTPGDG
jgi:para-nitrobenzyl esterase